MKFEMDNCMGRFARLDPDRMGDAGRSLLSSLKQSGLDNLERLAEGRISSIKSSSELTDICRSLEKEAFDLALVFGSSLLMDTRLTLKYTEKTINL